MLLRSWDGRDKFGLYPKMMYMKSLSAFCQAMLDSDLSNTVSIQEFIEGIRKSSTSLDEVTRYELMHRPPTSCPFHCIISHLVTDHHHDDAISPPPISSPV